jgi:hypothetical protein
MSAPPKVTFSQSRSWLWGRQRSTYSAAFPCSESDLSRVIHAFMKHVVPEVMDPTSGALRHNIKGRTPSERLINALPSPLRDETFCVGGLIARAVVGEEFLWEEFALSSLSNFKEFCGDTEILFSAEPARTSNIPSWLPTRLIGAAAPLRPRFFRFGIEHFRTLRSFASISAIPEVTESFFVDCSDSLLLLRVTIESKKRITSRQLDDIPCVLLGSEVLSKIMGWSFASDMKSRL